VDAQGPPVKRIAGVAFAASLLALTAAHIGSPNVLFDGNAGPYAVRVIVRPPEVVPGLAEVVVRLQSVDAQRVSIRPVFWRAGVRGAPSGDQLSRVPGEASTYSGRLWLMAYGAYSMYVTVDGTRGSGTVIVPVSSFATGRLPLPRGLGAILVVLAVLLVAGFLTLVRAGAGESLVAPGETIDAPRRRRANVVTGFAAAILSLALFGGAMWWNAADSAYQRNMFASPKVDARFTVDASHRTLELRVHDTARFHAISSPVAPDHGKMMHLFLVSSSGMQALAHLHPIQTDSLVFRTEVPSVPAGRYLLFGDIMLENGLSLTVETRIELPPAPGAVTPQDTDDTWDRTATVTPIGPGAVHVLSDGYSMAWAGSDGPITAGTPTDLRFAVRDSTGAIATVKPYLGMASHAVIIAHDGSVFIHLHPMGTVTPTAQQVFALRDRGDTTQGGRLRTEELQPNAMMNMPMSGLLTVPYEFPKPGRYRIWVQAKPNRRVLTGTFDVDVR
jgi:hypothetical protein